MTENKENRGQRMFWFLFFCDEILTRSSFSEGSGHRRGKSGREIKQELKESWRNTTCCLAHSMTPCLVFLIAQTSFLGNGVAYGGRGSSGSITNKGNPGKT